MPHGSAGRLANNKENFNNKTMRSEIKAPRPEPRCRQGGRHRTDASQTGRGAGDTAKATGKPPWDAAVSPGLVAPPRGRVPGAGALR